MVNSKFTALCSKAWALQILAYLVQGGDPRISPMAHHLTAGRTAITASLKHLIKLGYLRRTGGHGHPLRPAYGLTRKGEDVAQWAVQLDGILAPEDWKIARRTWSLPVLRVVDTSRRFGELRSQLVPVSDRALSETLKLLAEIRWLRRDVNSKAMPPSVTYSSLGTGQILLPCLKESFDL